MKLYKERFFNYLKGPYYTYVYFDPLDSVPFYVGKGKNKRAFSHLKEKFTTKGNKTNFSKLNKIKRIKDAGLLPKIQFAASGLCEKDAYDFEQELISMIGTVRKNTGPLTNLVTAGGRFYDHPSNLDTYKKISIALKERYSKIPIHFKGRSLYGKDNPRYNDHRNFEELHGKEKAARLREACCKRYAGKGNPNAKSWKLTDPNGVVHIIDGELKKFCIDNELSIQSLNRQLGNPVKFVNRYNTRYPKTSGWKLEKL